MTRRRGAFGLVLGVVLAIVAMTAPAARGELTFTAYEGILHLHSYFTGFQNIGSYEFKPTATSFGVNCQETTFIGTSATGESKTLTVFPPSSTPCGSFATQYLNSCDYSYNITKKINEHKYEGTTDIQCTKKGDVIDIKIRKPFPEELKTRCTITIEEQNGIGPIYYENFTPNTGLKFVVIKAQATNVKSITEAESGDPKDCLGVGKLGTHATGTLTAETTLSAIDTFPKEVPLEVTVSD